MALLGLNWYRPKDPRTPLGLAVIASHLLNHIEFVEGSDLHFINIDVRGNISNVVHEILTINPRVVGIGVYIWNIMATQQVIFGLRALGYTGTIVLGGPEITYGNKNLIQEHPGANYYVKGDGEIAFYNIVLYEAGLSKILGNGIFTPESQDFRGLSKINSDIMISPFQNPRICEELIGRSTESFTRWQTQRGCLYRCTFCAFPNGFGGMYEMNLEKVRSDLELFAQEGVKEVAVLDPIFFVHRDRAMMILEMITEICPEIRFEIQTKIEHLDDELLDKISTLDIILECGIQTLDPLVQKHIKRRNNKKRIEQNLLKISERNIPLEVHLIYGLPYQTTESLCRDFLFLSKFTENIFLFPLNRLKGTGLDIALGDTPEMTFSPIFPKEVIQTRWMDQEIIFKLKDRGIAYMLELCGMEINDSVILDSVSP